MRILRLVLPLVLVLAAAVTAASAAAAGPATLTSSDVPGLARRAVADGVVRTELSVPLRAALRTAVRRADASGARFSDSRRSVVAGSVVFAREADARQALATWRGARPRPGRAQLGDGAAVQVLGRRDVRVIVRSGRTLGVVRYRGPRARPAALAFAAALASRLSTAASEEPLDRLAADGVSAREALQGFSLVYGRLPGVRLPAGAQPDVLSGTRVASWLLAHAGELTANQRAAAEQALGVGLPGGSAVAATASLEPDPALTAKANAVAAQYAGLIGHTLGLRIDIGYVPSIPKAYADAVPVDADGDGSLTAAVACKVRVSREKLDANPAALDHAIAHELFHCFEYDLNPSGYVTIGDWIIEGLAEWAAATVAPAGSDYFRLKFGTRYFALPETPLFERSYDAAYFWGRVEELTGPLWTRVPAVVRSAGGADAVAAGGGNATEVLDAWAPSLTRRDRPSSAWTTGRPWVVAQSEISAPWGTITGPLAVDAAAWTNQLYGFQADPERPVLNVRVSRGHVRLTDGPELDRVLHGGDEALYCYPSGCECPSGETSKLPPVEDVALLEGAVSGGAAGASMVVSYRPMSDYCEPDEEPDFGDGGQTNGDPHLTSFDGLHFDFQAAGEFVLARHGELEVQVRQEPWQESRDATVNTAVAMRVGGARVTFEPGQPPLVRVNGRPVAIAAGGAVAAGRGRIARSQYGDELTVRWPDGSAALVRTIGSYGLVLDLAPAAGHRGRLRGLLGNFDGNPGNDLVGRGGARVAYALAGAGSDVADWKRPREERRPSFFRALYRTWGDSWRLTPGESLFTYGRGQSTASFTDRSIPRRPLGLEDFPAASRGEAERVCREAGVTDPAVLEDCMLDLLVTGEGLFAEAAAEVEQAARASGWLPVANVADRTSPLSLARTDDGLLHAVFARPGQLVDVVLDGGAPRDGTVVGTGEGEPVAVPAPHGGLRVLVGGQDGVRAFGSEPPWTAWSPLAAASPLATRYRVAGATTADGAIVAAVTDGIRFRVVRDGAPAPVDPAADAPGCATSSAALARDAAGAIWAAWLQGSCAASGIRVARLNPADGTVAAVSETAPGSAGFAPNGTTSISFAVRSGGGVHVAYTQDLGDGAYRVVLWPVGAAEPLEVARLSYAPRSVQASAEPGTGRIWIAWEDGYRERLWTARTAPDAATLDGPARVLDPPPDRPAILDVERWYVDARAGALDVLYGVRPTQDGPAGAVFATTLQP